MLNGQRYKILKIGVFHNPHGLKNPFVVDNLGWFGRDICRSWKLGCSPCPKGAILSRQLGVIKEIPLKFRENHTWFGRDIEVCYLSNKNVTNTHTQKHRQKQIKLKLILNSIGKFTNGYTLYGQSKIFFKS